MTDKTKNLMIFGYICFLAFWAIANVGEIFWLFYCHDLSLFHSGNQVGLTDFLHFYIAGKITASPLRAESFNWEFQRRFFENITNISFKGGSDFYTPYFPLTFVLMVPWSFLPLELSHLMFAVVTTIFGLLGIWWLVKVLGDAGKPMSYFVIIGILASNPAWRNWTQGQIMWFFLGLMVIYLACFIRKKNLMAGIVLAISTIKPQYVIYLLMPALALKRWQLLLSFFISDIILALICGNIFSWQSLINYPTLLDQYEMSSASVKALSMNCLLALFSLILPQATAFRLCSIIDLICIIAMFCICVYVLAKKENAQIFKWLISLLVLVSLIFSPHTHLHDTLLVAVPAILTLPSMGDFRTISKSRALSIWWWTMLSFPLTSWLCFILTLFGLPGNFLLTLIMVVLMLCALSYIVGLLKVKNLIIVTD